MYYEHGIGGISFEFEILAETRPAINEQDEELDQTIAAAGRMIRNALMLSAIKNDPKTRIARAEERAEILGLFDETIYVTEIPNGYGSGPYYQFRPWFLVTTKIGVFKIGWRKSVIAIYWDATECKKTAEDLFPDEETTKDGRMIHAWNLASAKRYIKTIMEAN
jgi:hypothetical protein